MSSTTPSTPKIILPLVFTTVALILSIVVMSTPGLFRLSILQNNGIVLQEVQTGPFHGCYLTSGASRECYDINSKCVGQIGTTYKYDFDVFRASASCAELNWMRAFLMITFFLGTISMLLGAFTKFSQRLTLKPAIILSFITGITSLITIGITIALFVGEVNNISNFSNTEVAFTYGSTLLIINIVLYFCSAIAYIRAKRLHTLNDMLQQPLVATTTTVIQPSYATVPVYTTAVPVYQQQQQQQQQGTYAYPVQQQQQQYYPAEGQQQYGQRAPQQL